ncbi:hypothetical protein [Saccharothrix sp. Mg75]|uniref:hypothetical protein n=1 Tax=Saccharothrix sp. Mg75 TaxID=3445357 RepID=UPI003EE91CA6
MYFVYRSHCEGPLGKVVRRLPDETVLAWFRRGWGCADPEGWVRDELGADVHDLDSVFRAARELGLPRPEDDAELRVLLHEHLYVEGDDDIRLDEHGLRVRTDDDEVELACFFFHDDVVEAAPDRLAYLLHEEWPLPDRADRSGPFDPGVPTTPTGPPGGGGATTYAVFLTFYDGESMARSRPPAFPGVALPELARHLRAADVAGAPWPPELMVLRALIAPDEDTLGPALDRCNRWPGFNSVAEPEPWPGLPDEHPAAHLIAVELVEAAEYVRGRRPQDSLLRVGDHLVQLAVHCDEAFGYQQWYLFDTAWAAAHPDLARSLLRYAEHWDPLAG